MNSNERLSLKLQRFLNPGEWNASVLGLSKSRGSSVSAGLVMIQIDGFSLTQLKTALAKNEMPFLSSLLKHEHYALHPLYPGLPCTTPSVQGELFYGVRQCIPAFFFFDKEKKKIFRMFDGADVQVMEERLRALGHGLLEGGSSYANIYAGGAQESHFCAGNLGWNKIWKDINPLSFLLLVFTHLIALLRMLVLFIWEIVLAGMDLIYGLGKKEDAATEFKFVPIRAGICVLLRELVTLGVKIDIARGLPIIHLNFIGYDEQAHRRGPSSKTAHWALKGIDAAIARIYHAAARSTRRIYDVWVYSDHGQEETLPYVARYGKSVEDVISGLYDKVAAERAVQPKESFFPKKDIDRGTQLQRGRYLGGLIEKIFFPNNHSRGLGNPRDIVVAAIGSVGHVYVRKDLDESQKFALAREMVHAGEIPLVLTPVGLDKAMAWTSRGEFLLPEQGRDVVGHDHPYYDWVIKDLIDMCHHPNAGDFTICGWTSWGPILSFPFENGAHAGPGPQETNAFALLPSDAFSVFRLRIMDLRKAAQALLRRKTFSFEPVEFSLKGNGPTVKPFFEKDVISRPHCLEENFISPQRFSKASHSNPRLEGAIRVMTYNVHSCVGMDGKISPARIARVIGRHEPDIVALQELDTRRGRTGGIDQPHEIARQLQMLYHFHPTIQIEEESYGDCVLSRFPMRLVQAEKLPGLSVNAMIEPRGALWTQIDVGGITIQFFNTHLGLLPREGVIQTQSLLGDRWLTHLHCRPPIVLCGDFNALPQSPLCRSFKKILNDVQEDLEFHQPLATWMSRYPMCRIDHVFVSPEIEVLKVRVSKTRLDRIASDHLPLIADIRLKK